MTGVKHDKGKARWSLMRWRELGYVLAVLEHGAAKYSDDNWSKLADAEKRILNAAMRHMVALMQGEERDPDSGLPHAAHVAANMLLCMQIKEENNGRH